MAVITTDKVILIVVVTIIVITLAYIFRFGRFSRKKEAPKTGKLARVQHDRY